MIPRALVLALLAAGPATALEHVLYTFDAVDTSTTAAVRVYTDRPLADPRLRVEAPRSEPRVLLGETRALRAAKRWVYRFSLRDLRPGAVYTLTVLDGERARGAQRTLSTLSPSAPLRVIAGGDLSTSAAAGRMWKAVAAERPDLILLGGDLAYANGNPKRGHLWDKLLAQRAAAFPDARLVPIVAAVGNHDVRGGYRGGPDDAPFWRALFGDASYFRLDLPGARLLVLDTDHLATPDAQTNFIDAALREPRAPGHWRIALYHAPLYPSVRPLESAPSNASRGAWMPRFKSGGLDLALENHEHTLKRVTRSGVLFLGDGCWGTEPRPTVGRRYLDRWASLQHVWVLEIEPGLLRARAVDARGQTLDKATLFRPVRRPPPPAADPR